jgi:hypothetical protein
MQMTLTRKIALKPALVAGFVFMGVAKAESNLPAICKDVPPPTGTTCTKLIYDIPVATDIVKGNGGYFGRWDQFTESVAVCTADIPRGSTVCPKTAEIAVTQVKGPTIAVAWTQELKNADGTPLTDLAGFRIVYGTVANALTQTVEIRDPNARSYTLANLAYSTTYYHAVKAFNAKGEESDKSNTAQQTTLAAPSKPVPPALTVQQIAAYRVNGTRDDQYTLTAIGTIPIGTACLRGFQPITDYFLVPRLAVKLNSGVTTRPKQIAAKCGCSGVCQ